MGGGSGFYKPHARHVSPATQHGTTFFVACFVRQLSAAIHVANGFRKSCASEA